MRSKNTQARSLSELEKSVIPAAISAGIDLDAIEIHKQKWTIFTPANVSVVRGNKIFYPNDPGPSENLNHLAHLVHETVHVWQYAYLGVGFYDPRWLDRRYRYWLDEGDLFQSFGLEQQASMTEDSFRVHNGLPTRWAKNRPSADLLAGTVRACTHQTGNFV